MFRQQLSDGPFPRGVFCMSGKLTAAVKPSVRCTWAHPRPQSFSYCEHKPTRHCTTGRTLSLIWTVRPSRLYWLQSQAKSALLICWIKLCSVQARTRSAKRPSEMALSRLPRSQYSMMILHSSQPLREGLCMRRAAALFSRPGRQLHSTWCGSHVTGAMSKHTSAPLLRALAPKAHTQLCR